MLKRDFFKPEHAIFRDNFVRFVKQELLPHDQKWQMQGYVDKRAWRSAGQKGFLCVGVANKYGGANADKLFSAIVIEELAKANLSSPGFGVHSDIVAPYIENYGNEDIKKRYLKKMATGEMIGAIAMTEPEAGSDLQSIKTFAERDEGFFILNGSKTFITNGWNSDIVIVAAKTNVNAGGKGISLFILEKSYSGFTKGKPLKKIGLKGQDTCELFFDNVRVPAANMLGNENKGFIYLMQELPWERLQIAIGAVAKSQAAINWTIEYVKNRSAFGRNLSDYQTVKFQLAELSTEVQIAQVFIDKCLELILDGKLETATASMAKYWTTDLEGKVMDTCLQMHGGYGFMWEYPIAQAFVDARVERIYGGSNEIMKELISRSIGLGSDLKKTD